MKYVGMSVKLNLHCLKRRKHHLYARSERTIASINPDEIVEGKCYRAVMKEGPVIFKVTEIKPSAVTKKDHSGATSFAQNRRTVFWVSRSVAKNSPWTKFLDRAYCSGSPVHVCLWVFRADQRILCRSVILMITADAAQADFKSETQLTDATRPICPRCQSYAFRLRSFF
jgi:hypothetical protein